MKSAGSGRVGSDQPVRRDPTCERSPYVAPIDLYFDPDYSIDSPVEKKKWYAAIFSRAFKYPPPPPPPRLLNV